MANRTAFSRVRETTITTSGAIQLAGAVAGFRTFASAHADQDPVWVVEHMGNDFQIMECVYNATANTLTIVNVLESYVGGVSTVAPSATANTWGAGSKEVYEDLPAVRAPFLDLVANNVPGARSALGVNQNVALGASQNFNTVTAAGSYYTIDNASTNAPLGSAYWYLFVENYGPSNTYFCQTATRLDVAGAATYTRTMVSGTWGAWSYQVAGSAPFQIPGDASGNAAAAGMVGEVAYRGGITGSLSSGVITNLASFTLQPGDWDIGAEVETNTSGATTTTDWNVVIAASGSTLTAAIGISMHVRVPSQNDFCFPFALIPQQAVLSSPTTYFLNGMWTGGSSQPTMTYAFRARRMR